MENNSELIIKLLFAMVSLLFTLLILANMRINVLKKMITAVDENNQAQNKMLKEDMNKKNELLAKRTYMIMDIIENRSGVSKWKERS